MKKRKKKGYSKEWLSIDEVKAMLSIKEMWFDEYMQIYLLYVCALRVSELCNLKVKDIDFERETLTIQESKNQVDPMDVPIMSKRLLSLLRKYIDTEGLKTRDYLFPGQVKGRPITRKAVYERCKRLAVQAGIRKAISTHTFRRSRATHLIDAGMSAPKVQRLLRHKRIKTTMEYYEYSVEEVRKEMFKVDPFAKE